MAEWLKAHAWKACIPQGIQGSNPCLSATPFPKYLEKLMRFRIYAQVSTANNYPILFADLSSYTLRTAGPLHAARLVERYAEFNEVGFIGYCRADGYNTPQSA
jgi:hypothetical protein